MADIYQPAEDSILLGKSLRKEIQKTKPQKLLDMGSGSGIQTEVAIAEGVNPENITLVDINSDAIRELKNRFPKSKVLKSDLFDNINEKFDLIVFNPPYLPENEFDRKLDTSGGEKGSETINFFLKLAKNFLTEKGKILLLTSSFTQGIDWRGYSRKLVSKSRVFFEELYVWELS